MPGGQPPPAMNGQLSHGPRPAYTMPNGAMPQGMPHSMPGGRPIPGGPPIFQAAQQQQQQRPGPGFPQQLGQRPPGTYDPSRGAGFSPQGATPQPYPPVQQRPPSAQEELSSPRMQNQIDNDMAKIPLQNLAQLRQELGIPDKESSMLTMEEKVILFSYARFIILT